MRQPHTNCRALGILAAVLIVAYAPVVFLGRSLVPTLFYPYGLPDGAPANGRLPANTFNIDLSDAYVGWSGNALSGALWRSGEVPLWNPYQGTGVPIAAQTYWSTFFPYQILEDVAPYWLWDVFILLRMWIAGAGS